LNLGRLHIRVLEKEEEEEIRKKEGKKEKER